LWLWGWGVRDGEGEGGCFREGVVIFDIDVID
jgi:hypothetical protein